MAKRSKGTIKVAFGHKDAKGKGGKINPRVPRSIGYVLKVTAAEGFKSQKNNPGVQWDFVVVKPKEHKGKKFRERTMLMPKNLWFLRQLLEGMGKKVPEKTVSLTLSKYIGGLVGATMQNDEYDGKPQSRIDEFMTPDEALEYEVEDDDDEDDDEFDDEDEDEEEDEDDEDEDDDDDEDEDDEDEDEEDEDDVDLDDEL